MGIDDFITTGLALQLGFSNSSPIAEIKPQFQNPITSPNFGKIPQPSLTLTLSGAAANSDDHIHRQDSAGSSFSSVKREREITTGSGGDEAEMDRISLRISDEDDNGRKKLRLSKAQSALLEESFKRHSTLNPKQKQDLARELKLRPRQVEVWFQNRRARTKLKQTEVDCEFLKKCCETLTDENQRLQKELHELKTLKLAVPTLKLAVPAPAPLYMRLPAATLAMCPSCERIVSGGAPVPESAAKSSYLMAPGKPHFYGHFANQSAAC